MKKKILIIILIFIILFSVFVFKNKILNSDDNYFGITNYISAITSPTFNNLRLSNVKTNNILKENGLNWPDITDDYINKIIDYLIRNGLMVI